MANGVNSISSSGHKLGQIIGDWYEEYFAYPLLESVAKELGLFLDTRFKQRADIRQGKILWEDYEGNTVDYDFVLELIEHGQDPQKQKGEPIGFFETFWRRGARHSKDKARDDSGKLIPMRSTYPTARVLGIIAAGDFTDPAREFVKSRNIDLFYVPKDKILNAWRVNGIEIDYPDSLPEQDKLAIAMKAESGIDSDKQLKTKIADSLRKSVGLAQLRSYKNTLMARMGATPQEYRIFARGTSLPFIHHSHEEVERFLSAPQPNVKFESISYVLEVIFGDGDCYFADNLSWEDLKTNYHKLSKLIAHMEKIAQAKE